MKNLSHKLQILHENDVFNDIQFYVNGESQCDPNFFRWLFDDENLNDFGTNMTNDQQQYFGTFYNSLKQD